MNWIFASILMFIGSVALYLSIRSNNYQKTPTELNNLAMYIVPLFLFLSIILLSGTSFVVTLYQFAIILILAVFFSYLGNFASLKSVELSPNPGYSLVISKSYVVFTSIVAIFAFDQSLTLKGVIGIIIILISSAIISIGKSKESNAKSSKAWLVYALIAFFCFGFMSLTSKYILTLGVQIIIRLFYSMLIVTTIILIDGYKKKINITALNKKQWLTLLIVGISAAFFYYFMQVALDTAPNIGYVNAINASSIGAITLLSAYIFKDELNSRKTVGVFGVLVGLILLVI